MKLYVASVAMLALAVGCSSPSKEAEKDPAKTLKADVIGVDGVLGEVTFTEVEGGVKLNFMVRNLPKGQTLASHIHEKNVCKAPSFKSAGGHFNPKKVKHGAPDAKVHHVGDLGNFEVDKNGTLKAEKVYKFLSLDPTSENYIGNRSLIIHEKKDRFTQPTGDAGGRIACAVL
ncbi:MAG TPA: superoxide dismutase [Bdellovibrionales bacterium]|nr:superoxide dismutase [Bdellovibrionales bacterium]|tara:strand:- start:2987 stop:3505 length:519 start_codon:yes stop_codon:yes gene_type:complete